MVRMDVYEMGRDEIFGHALYMKPTHPRRQVEDDRIDAYKIAALL